MATTGKGLPVVRDAYSAITFRTAFKIIDSRFNNLSSQIAQIQSDIQNISVGSVASINDIGDVDVSGVVDGQILGYQLSTGKWIPVNQSSGGGAVPDATLTTKGIVRLATVIETNTGSDNSIALNPVGLKAWTGSVQINTVGTINAGVWQGNIIQTDYLFKATELLAGVLEIATLAEVNAGAVDLVVTADKFINATIDGGTF